MNEFREVFKATNQTVKDEANRIGISRPTFTKIVSSENDLPEDLTIRTLRYFALQYGQRVKITLEPIDDNHSTI